MIHLFKIQLQNSDMFISEITEDTITYSIREKENGRLLEPAKQSRYTTGPDTYIHFDNRFIDINLANYIGETLK